MRSLSLTVSRSTLTLELAPLEWRRLWPGNDVCRIPEVVVATDHLEVRKHVLAIEAAIEKALREEIDLFARGTNTALVGIVNRLCEFERARCPVSPTLRCGSCVPQLDV